jgi:hypothetical protein
MNQLPHPNVTRLLALDPIFIKGLDRDSTIRHLGWSDGLTPD